jgi:uncharacterized protein (TIGR02145 family)
MKIKLIIGLITALEVILSTSSFSQNEWLYFPINTNNNRIDVGNLNVSGDSITVEALITKQISTPSSYYNIVSKHNDPADCNYLLRPATFEMSTTSGFITLTNPRTLCFDSTYHVAATYDGDSVKYFVNGVQVASQHWTGTLVQNSLTTGIGNMSSISGFYEQFIGYIDEVRIWKVARSRVEIAGNMYNLPNPTTQYGLLAYYKFDGNYNNSQGNPAYNGVPVGTQLRDTVNTLFNGSVSNLPVIVNITITASGNPVCAGTPVTFTAIPVNGGNLPVFQWKVNGVNVGTNSPIYIYSPINGDVVICQLTSSLCSINNPASSNQITMVVNPTFPVSISIVASSNPFCQGASISFTGTPINGGLIPTFHWFVNGINTGINSPVYSYSPANGDIVYCVLNSSIACPSGNPATSNLITMIEIPNSPVSVSINVSDNPVCSGTLVTFTATPTNPGTTPFYQWQVNGINAGTNSTTYTYTPVNADVVTCILNSSIILCTSNNPATSNAITMVVNTVLPVSITISPSLNPVCADSLVTFTATPGNGGISPTYQWKVNGIAAGTNLSTYSYIPLNGDLITCMLTSSEPCSSGNPASSNQIQMIVNPNNPVNISVAASQNPVCAGNFVTFTATPTNGGITPSYQWKVNGINSGPDLPVYTYVPVNGDNVSCILTSSTTACSSNNPATSNVITMIVNPVNPVNVSIASTAITICQGTSVTFTATPTNGGLAPSYQWQVNGVNAGINNSVYTYIPANNDQVTCILTSSLTVCVLNNPAISNTITMTVSSNLPVSETISANANPVCAGSSVTFTATPVNGGTSPTYQWEVNGINAGTNSNLFTYIPSNNDVVSCLLTSNLTCTTGNPATSNPITMTINGNPVVTLTPCFDTITTLNAKPIKLKGGIPLGGTYSGPGVNPLTGILTPSVAGTGTKTITYTYTNAVMCSASKSIHIIVQAAPVFTCGNNLTDIRDNKAYPTIQIGSQCWMTANLNFGTILASSQDQRDNCISEKYCYNDNPTNCTNQGGLYQWDELMLYDYTPADQGFCPPGWHIPTENEWNTLFAIWTNNGFAGSPLKYSGYSGFVALLSGARYINKSWDFQGFATFFWSSTSYGTDKAWAHGLNDPDPSVSVYPAIRVNAFSVRCLKD